MTKQEVILLLRNARRFKARCVYLRYTAKKLTHLLKLENDKVAFSDYLQFPKGIIIREEEGEVEKTERVAEQIVDGESPKRIKEMQKELNYITFELSQINKAQRLIKAFQEGLTKEQWFIVDRFYIKGGRQKEVHQLYMEL